MDNCFLIQEIILFSKGPCTLEMLENDISSFCIFSLVPYFEFRVALFSHLLPPTYLFAEFAESDRESDRHREREREREMISPLLMSQSS